MESERSEEAAADWERTPLHRDASIPAPNEKTLADDSPSDKEEGEMGDPERLVAPITAALAVTAEEEGPRSPYFAPRRLGATAPHDCRIWSLDLRDGRIGEDDDEAVLGDEPVRRLEDPDLLDQLELLLDAGLRASVA